jgi:hypothetical protein
MVRSEPEPGYRWLVGDAGSGAVLGWFGYRACWFADQQGQAGRQVEIGYGGRCLWQPPRARQRRRQPCSEPEGGT